MEKQNEVMKEQNVAQNNEKEHEQDKQVEEGVEELSMDFSGDWAADSIISPDDPLYKKQLVIKQKIKSDCSLNSQDMDNSDDGEDDISSVPHGKRAPSSPPKEASPSKMFRESESPTPGQQVDGESPTPPPS